MMKMLSLALTVATGLVVASTQAATYNGNLIIGFSDGFGDDLVYDLGPYSSITNGQTWNLNALLSAYTLSTVNWGVVGNSTTAANGGIGTSRKIWTTRIETPSTVTGNSFGANINTADASIYQSFGSAGTGQNVYISPLDDNSWNRQTINPTLTGQYQNVYGNPNATGTSTISFWQAIANNSTPVIVGSFSLATNGVVTFTPPSSTPPAPTLSITRNGNVSSISFLSANSATYTLLFTNSIGLTTSAANWPVLGGTIAGDGTIKTFTDTTSDANRSYRVKAQ